MYSHTERNKHLRSAQASWMESPALLLPLRGLLQTYLNSRVTEGSEEKLHQQKVSLLYDPSYNSRNRNILYSLTPVKIGSYQVADKGICPKLCIKW